MRKSHIRDYATSAFQFFALEGSAEGYRQRIWNEAVYEHQQREIHGSAGAPTESAVIHADIALKAHLGAIADLEAVEKVIHALELMEHGHILKALRIVYMQEPEREIEWGEIKDRMQQASLSIPASERQVYRWLAEVRRMFAEERGLRI